MPGCIEGYCLEGKFAAASNIKPSKPSIMPENQTWATRVWPALPWETCTPRAELSGVLVLRCWGRTWERNPSSEEMSALGCFLSKLTPAKNSQPFHSWVFLLALMSEPWHSSPQPTAGSHRALPYVPASALGQAGPLGHPGVSCPPVLQQKPGDPAGKGLVWGAPDKGRGCSWSGERSRQSLCQQLPINPTEHRAVASPGNPRPSLALTELSLPDAASEKQVPDVTCLIICPFPKDKAPCSSCTEGRVDTCGGSSELCFAPTADRAHWNGSSKKDNCIKAWSHFFVFNFLLGEIK